MLWFERGSIRSEHKWIYQDNVYKHSYCYAKINTNTTFWKFSTRYILSKTYLFYRIMINKNILEIT